MGSRIEDVATKLVAVTASDTTSLRVAGYGVPRAIYVGGAGNVALLAADDTSAVTLVGVPAGAYLLIAAEKVMATNTTATSIVALYAK